MKRILIGLVALSAIAVSFLVPATAHAYTYYGAIAVARSGAMGWGLNYGSESDAESAALDQCGYSDCSVLTTFFHCGAIDYSPSTGDYTGGRGDSIAEAENSAHWYSDSYTERWACNGS
ncbi:DUF4189 domain-containing protein [Nocardia sp. NPDC020380]|uniref:DUF4189 domain-containing protein n=1 Tax=Nocardia sp. NPDC020380 TaxID=3364309 RepID=UPI0037A34562